MSAPCAMNSAEANACAARHWPVPKSADCGLGSSRNRINEPTRSNGYYGFVSYGIAGKTVSSVKVGNQ
jgi:hypothetical protein